MEGALEPKRCCAVWTDSTVFTEFTVFPPNHWEDSQLKTRLSGRELGETQERERTHGNPC